MSTKTPNSRNRNMLHYFASSPNSKDPCGVLGHDDQQCICVLHRFNLVQKHFPKLILRPATSVGASPQTKVDSSHRVGANTSAETDFSIIEE